MAYLELNSGSFWQLEKKKHTHTFQGRILCGSAFYSVGFWVFWRAWCPFLAYKPRESTMLRTLLGMSPESLRGGAQVKHPILQRHGSRFRPRCIIRRKIVWSCPSPEDETYFRTWCRYFRFWVRQIRRQIMDFLSWVRLRESVNSFRETLGRPRGFAVVKHLRSTYTTIGC